MQPIVKVLLMKASISITFHIAVRYGPRYLQGIGLFHPFIIKGSGQIVFIIEHFCNLTPYIQLLCAKLSTLQHEARRRRHILENYYHETH